MVGVQVESTVKGGKSGTQVLMTSNQNTQMALQQRSSAGTWGMAKKKIQVIF